MKISCNIRGVPRIINIKMFAGTLIKGYFDIRAKATGRPNGREKTNVSTKIFIDVRLPASIAAIMVGLLSP
jgi:hypothetical protein